MSGTGDNRGRVTPAAQPSPAARFAVLAGIAAVAGIAWTYLIVAGGRMPGATADLHAVTMLRPWSAIDTFLMFLMWAVMMVSTSPMLGGMLLIAAGAYAISANHLAKVMRDLGRAGLVQAVRGAGGGYRFSGNAKRTSLYDVIILFDDVIGREGGRPGPADETEVGRALARVLNEIDEITIATFKSITLATLLKTMGWHEERSANAGGVSGRSPE